MTKTSGIKSKNDRASRIYSRLKGMRGVDESELWQHALFFAMTPQERCRFSLKTARSVLAMRNSTGVLPAEAFIHFDAQAELPARAARETRALRP